MEFISNKFYFLNLSFQNYLMQRSYRIMDFIFILILHCFKAGTANEIRERNTDIEFIMGRFDNKSEFAIPFIGKDRKMDEDLREKLHEFTEKISSPDFNKDLLSDVYQSKNIAYEYLCKNRRYDKKIFDKIISKFFNIVAYYALNEKDILYRVGTEILDRKTSIAIYTIAIYKHLKGYESEYYEKYELKTFDELCNYEKLRLIIMEDIESAAKKIRIVDDPVAIIVCVTS